MDVKKSATESESSKEVNSIVGKTQYEPAWDSSVTAKLQLSYSISSKFLRIHIHLYLDLFRLLRPQAQISDMVQTEYRI